MQSKLLLRRVGMRRGHVATEALTVGWVAVGVRDGGESLAVVLIPTPFAWLGQLPRAGDGSKCAATCRWWGALDLAVPLPWLSTVRELPCVLALEISIVGLFAAQCAETAFRGLRGFATACA